MVERRKYSTTHIRANLDYGESEALTTYGIIGVKVWIYKGELFDKDVDKEKIERVKMLQPTRSKFRKAFKGRIMESYQGLYFKLRSI